MAQTSIVGAAKAIYRGTEAQGVPTVGESMSWGTTAAEVQTITITGTPTGGTVKLTHRGVPGTPVAEETSALTFDDVFGDVDAALEALSSVTTVVVAGGAWPGSAMTVTWDTPGGAAPVYKLKPTSIALTGGTDVAVTVVRTTRGSAGWTEVENVDEKGVEIVLEYETEELKRMAAQRPHELHTLASGVSAVRFSTLDTLEATLDLALPDGDVSGAYLTGGAARSYIAMAVHTDNCVWYFPRVSAVGNLALVYNNAGIARPGLEFTVLEEKYVAAGTSNFRCYPIT